MITKLISQTESHPGLVLTLADGDKWIIGCDPIESNLVIEDPSIAPTHVIIHRNGTEFVLENLTDQFLSNVNDEGFDSPYTLQKGDVVRLGDLSFVFSQEEETSENNMDSEHLENESSEDLENESPDDKMLANIHFGLEEQGRWLLKVIGGPNNGAEFHMESAKEYILGTDPKSADIIFQDNSVSRQHAKISILDNDSIEIEDLNSKNGIFIKNERIQGKQSLPVSTIVTVGTTSFIIYDREGDMHTIISPLLPSIVKSLQQEQKKNESPAETPSPKQSENSSTALPAEKEGSSRYENIWLIIGVLALLFVIGYGTYTLFVSSPVHLEDQESIDISIQKALSRSPNIQYTFNQSTGALAIFGHVLTTTDKNELLYNLSPLKKIKSIESQGLIIDEHVWKEFNSVLGNNRSWRGITVHTVSPGVFVVSGLLKSRKESEELNDYLRLNFPYYESLDNKIVVEEEIEHQIGTLLVNKGLRGVIPTFANGELLFKGYLSSDQSTSFEEVLKYVNEIPGIKSIRNEITKAAPAEIGIINLSDRYEVSGYSQLGNNNYSIVIDGRILQEGYTLDGMFITKITDSTVFLSKGDRTFRINY
jgi:type III secretion system YscD/HrpQ family protein